MNIFNSIIKGLDESLKIEKDELKASKDIIKIDDTKTSKIES